MNCIQPNQELVFNFSFELEPEYKYCESLTSNFPSGKISQVPYWDDIVKLSKEDLLAHFNTRGSCLGLVIEVEENHDPWLF